LAALHLREQKWNNSASRSGRPQGHRGTQSARLMTEPAIAELAPHGALEHDIVANLSRLIWRKQNLATLRIAELARSQTKELFDELMVSIKTKTRPPSHAETANSLVYREMRDMFRAKIQNEFGSAAFDLVEMKLVATFDSLTRELDIEERFGTMIDKCLKRLLFLKGIKSIAIASSAVRPSASAPLQLVSGSSRGS
jgi:hypothetical protein